MACHFHILDEKTALFRGAGLNLTCEWILGKYTVQKEDLVDIYEKALPEPLHQYLL